MSLGESIEARTTRRVALRIVPFLIICYLVSYLDRVNIGFAALTMNKELGLSAEIYGLGAGIFFFTYFLFEVPSNLMLHRFGARRWIARIMLSWGIVSGAMGFIPQIASVTGFSQTTVFYAIRLLLGAAEAGFFPGIIFYLTLWFPSAYRARVIGYFMAAIPISGIVGAPLSGSLLGLDGYGGLAGWQWLFIIESVPAVLMAILVLVYLTDRPAEAAWLTADERAWLRDTLAREERDRAMVAQQSIWQTLANPIVLALSLVYFGIVAMNYSLNFFLPLIVKDFGLSNFQTGLVVAIPSIVGTVSMVFWGRRSDRQRERKWHLSFALFVGAVCFGLTSVIQDPVLKMVFFSIAAFGIYAALPVLWTLPTSMLSGASAAAGIAIINSLANLSGFAGPYVMGWVKTSTGEYKIGLIIVAAIGLLATIVAASFNRERFPIARTNSVPQAAE
jgi:MFS transporter, ACS family, tartrate transporter